MLQEHPPSLPEDLFIFFFQLLSVDEIFLSDHLMIIQLSYTHLSVKVHAPEGCFDTIRKLIKVQTRVFEAVRGRRLGVCGNRGGGVEGRVSGLT